MEASKRWGALFPSIPRLNVDFPSSIYLCLFTCFPLVCIVRVFASPPNQCYFFLLRYGEKQRHRLSSISILDLGLMLQKSSQYQFLLMPIFRSMIMCRSPPTSCKRSESQKARYEKSINKDF